MANDYFSGQIFPPNPSEDITVTAKSKFNYFDINSFRTEIYKNEILPTHSYLVTFAPFRLGSEANAPLTEFTRYNADKLTLRCDNVMLPTVQVLEEENIRRYGYGPVEKVPYGMQFTDLSLTWLVDKRSELIDFFYQWMNTIVMYETSGGRSIANESARESLSSYTGYEVGYKDEYTCPIVRIRVYDRELKTVTEYELYDVFPMNIQSQNLAWAQENEAQRLTVTFGFTDMKTRAPAALTGKLEELLNAKEAAKQAASSAAAAANAAEKDRKKREKRDYKRNRGRTPQNSVGASSPNALNNTPPRSTSKSVITPETMKRNLSGTKIA